MSGLLSTIIGRADLAASLLFGGSGGVVLGDFAFEDFEIPEQISWGGQQQITVHKFPGGARVIDAMGRDDMPLSWSGIFLNDPETRARQIDEMRIAGEAVPLTWRDFSYTVIISDFRCDTRAFHSPYQITCTVLSDDSASDDSGEPSILQQIGADINSALGFNVSATVSNALSVAQTASTALTVLTGGSAAALALQNDLSLAKLANNTAAAAADSRLLNSALGTVSSPSTAIASLTDSVDASGIASAARSAAGYIGRSTINATQGAH